jgi:hypothetical protein
MKAQKKTIFADEDTRSLLKNQHRKVYSICRLFANNYKEHQALLSTIFAAASRYVQKGKTADEKKTLFLRACINMAALHSLSRDLETGGLAAETPIQFQSPDYQKSMVSFREAIGETNDYQKILLFLGFEKVAPDEIPSLTGLSPVRPKEPKKAVGQRFIPYLKEKIIWS